MMGRLRTEFWLTWKFIHNLWSLLILLLQTFSNLLLLSHSFMSDSLQPHELQHVRLPCPSLSPGVCTNSCPLNRWCDPTISSSVIPSSSCLQSFPASGSFSNESVLRVRFSFSISPSNEYSGLISFRIDCLDILAVQGTHKSLLKHHSSKASILQHSALLSISHIYTWLLEKQ